MIYQFSGNQPPVYKMRLVIFWFLIVLCKSQFLGVGLHGKDHCIFLCVLFFTWILALRLRTSQRTLKGTLEHTACMKTVLCGHACVRGLVCSRMVGVLACARAVYQCWYTKGIHINAMQIIICIHLLRSSPYSMQSIQGIEVIPPLIWNMNASSKAQNESLQGKFKLCGQICSGSAPWNKRMATMPCFLDTTASVRNVDFTKYSGLQPRTKFIFWVPF